MSGALRALILLAVTAGCILAQGRGGNRGRGGPRPKTASESTVPGDAGRGRAIFDGKGGCLSCHRVEDRGSRTGPELTDIAVQRTVEELEKSILDPNPEVRPQNRLYRVVPRDGAAVTGKLLNQDTSSVQMLDSEGHLVAFSKAALRSYGFLPSSPMPSYKGKLSPEEVTDLIAYLATLAGGARP